MLRLRPPPPNVMGNVLSEDIDGRCEADVLIIAGDATPGLCVVSKAGVIFTWDKRKGYGYGGAWLIYTGDDLSDFETTFTVWREDQRADWDVWAKKYLSKPQFAKPQLPNPGATNAAATAQIAQAQATVDAFANNSQATPSQRASAAAQLAAAQSSATAASSASPYVVAMPAPKAFGVANPILNELGINKIVPKRIGQWTKVSPGRWSKTVEWWQWNPPVPRLGRPSAAIDDTKKKAPTADDAAQLQLRSKQQDLAARKARIAQLQGLS